MPSPDYRSYELWSKGVNPLLQGVGTGPRGDFGDIGLRVPTLATSNKLNRYLFMLCGFEVGDGAVAHITGVRTLWSLFVKQTTDGSGVSYAETDVASPIFKLPDGDVSFHLRRMAHRNPQRIIRSNGPTDLSNFRRRMCVSPALLYETATLGTSGYYTDITAYTPPNNGSPYGEHISGLATFHDSRWEWRSSQGWSSIDIRCDQPGFYCMFASVRQSSGTYNEPAFAAGGAATPELIFINAYKAAPQGGSTTGVIIGRVGASMIIRLYDGNGYPLPDCEGRRLLPENDPLRRVAA